MRGFCALPLNKEERQKEINKIQSTINDYNIKLPNGSNITGEQLTETAKRTILLGYIYEKGKDADLSVEKYLDNYFFKDKNTDLVVKNIEDFKKIGKIVNTLKDLNRRYMYFTNSMVRHINSTLSVIPYPNLVRFVQTGENSYIMFMRNVVPTDNSTAESEQDKTVETLNSLFEYNSRTAMLDKDTHTYKVFTYRKEQRDFDWVTIGDSVTTIAADREGREKENNKSISSLLGTMFDGIARHFFQNIDNYRLGEDYNEDALVTAIEAMDFSSNVMTKTNIRNTAQSLINAAKVLDNKFGKNWKALSSFNNEDLPPIYGYIKKNGRELFTAGTLDMVIVDNEGFIHLVDFKTFNNSNDKKSNAVKESLKYRKQLNFYKELLEKSIPELKGKIKSLQLLAFGRDNVIDSNLNDITEEERKHVLDDKGNLVNFLKNSKFTGFLFGENVGGLFNTEFYKSDDTETTPNWNSESISARLLAKEDVRRGSFAASKLNARRRIRAHGLNDVFTLNMSVTLAKRVVELGRSVFTSKDDKLYRELTGTNKEEYDTRPKNIDQSDFIAKHLNLLYNMAIGEMNDRGGARKQLADLIFEDLDIKNYIKYLGLPTLRYLEGIVVDSSNTSYVDPYTDEDEEDEARMLEQKVYQNWQFEHNQRSFRSSLSIDIKRVLSLLPTGTGDYCDANVVTNLLLKRISRVSSVSKMINTIKGIDGKGYFPEEAKNALVKILEKDEIFKSKFYQAFRKTQVLYGNVETYIDKDGYLRASVKILNVGGEAKAILEKSKGGITRVLNGLINSFENTQEYKEVISVIDSLELSNDAKDGLKETFDDLIQNATHNPLKLGRFLVGLGFENSLALVKANDIILAKRNTGINAIRTKLLKLSNKVNRDISDNVSYQSIIHNILNKQGDYENFFDDLQDVLKSVGFDIEDETLSDTLSIDSNKSDYILSTLYALFTDTNKLIQLYSNILKDSNALEDALKRYGDNIFKCRETIGGSKVSSIYNPCKKLAQLLGNGTINSVQTTAYFDGKNYYAYTNSSFLNNLVNKLNGQDTSESIQGFIEKTFYKSRYFKDGDIVRNHWLKAIYSHSTLPQHKVELGFNNVTYKDMGSLTYQMALINEYFADTEETTFPDNSKLESANRRLAWFRVQTMSNKPASEFVRMHTYNKSEIAKNVFDLFKQEIWRIKTVIKRAGIKDNIPIQNFDLFFKESDKKKLSKELLDKLTPDDNGNYEPLTREDLDAVVKLGKGAKFYNLRFLNKMEEGSNKDIIYNYILNEINGVPVPDVSAIDETLKNLFNSYMHNVFNETLEEWKTLGMFDFSININNGNILINYDNIPAQWANYNLSAIATRSLFQLLTASNVSGSKELLEKLTADNANPYNILNEDNNIDIVNKVVEESTRQLLYDEQVGDESNKAYNLRAALEDYFYNDWYATTQFNQIASVDYAYFKNMDDFQKRNSELHSPVLRMNKEARDNKGRLVSDGIHRSVIIYDMEGTISKSTIIAAIESVFDKEKKDLEKNYGKDSPAYIAYTDTVEWILDQYRNGINVTDGQAYSSPTSYRKKMYMTGEWNDRKEELYQKIKSGDLKDIYALREIFQPLKPFAYGQNIEDAGIVSTIGGKAVDEKMVVIRQHKNSEYLLCMADAIIQEGVSENVNKLRAIYDFMEESADPEKLGKYDAGIDTIEFASCVKVGLSGAIDINKYNTEKEIKEALEKACYVHDKNGAILLDPNTNARIYNKSYVHELDYDYYGIQQNKPAHFQDHDQLLGSQSRVLINCDLQNLTVWNGKEFVTLSEEETRARIDTYYKACADNINIAANELLKDLGYKETRFSKKYDKKAILSSFLKKSIQENEKYAYDIIEALELDDNGNFVLPPYDPSISIRIQELISSLVKDRINKQTISGGPLVQVTSWGTSKTLNIRWRDAKNNLLYSKEEFEKLIKSTGSVEGYTDYDTYISNKKHSIAHLEAFAPCPSAELEELLTVEENGKTRMLTPEEAVRRGRVSQAEMDRITELIGYRIPTEAKYSMMPIKIVGFLPRFSGEGIMLPYEVTTLTGADFDIDVLYIIRRSSRIVMRNLTLNDVKKAAETAAKNYLSGVPRMDNTWKTLHRIATTDEIASGILNGILNNDASNINKLIMDEEARKTFLRELKPSFNITPINTGKDAVKYKNDDIIFQHQWDVLRDPSSLDKIFNPGNFERPKKVARLITLLKAIKKSGREVSEEFINSLSSKSREELEDLLEEYETDEHDLNFSRAQLYYHKQNMAAAKLIGIFANHNVSHAVLQLQNIYYKPNVNRGIGIKDFNIGGYSIKEGRKLDDYKSLDNITYISKCIAEFVAASVDAAKDPVLNFLNLNLATANVAMTLIRLGVDAEAVGLFLSQDVLVELADKFAKFSDKNGYANAESIATEMLRERISGDDFYNTIENIKNEISNGANYFSKESLVNNLLDKSSQKELDAKILVMFSHLLSVSKDLNEMVFETKFNSINNSVGPQIAHTYKNRARVNKFENDQLDTSNDSETAAHFAINLRDGKYVPDYDKDNRLPSSIISNNPILNAFYSRTYGKVNTNQNIEVGLENIIMRDYFPQYGSTIPILIKQIMSLSKSNYIDERKYNNIVNEYFFYKITESLDLDLAERTRIIRDFPKEFRDLAKTEPIINPNTGEKIGEKSINPEISYIYKYFMYLNRDKEEIPFDRVDIRENNLNPEDVAFIHACMNTLCSSSNPVYTTFARDFMLYSLYRSAYNYNGKAAFHLLTAEVLASQQGYVNAMRSIYDNRDMYSDNSSKVEENFVMQYLLHHTDDWATVPTIRANSKGAVKLKIDKAGDNEIKITVYKESYNTGQNTSNQNLFKQSYIGAKDGPYEVVPVIKYGKKIYALKSSTINGGTVIYKEIKPLGKKGILYEYDGNSDYTDIESIIDVYTSPESISTNRAMTTEDMNYDSARTYIETQLLNPASKKYTSAEEELIKSVTAVLGPSKTAEIFNYDDIKDILKSIC